MISPPSHAGGGTTTTTSNNSNSSSSNSNNSNNSKDNSNADRSGPDRQPASSSSSPSPPPVRLHLDQNSNKSSRSGGDRRRKDPSPLSEAAGGGGGQQRGATSSPNFYSHHHQHRSLDDLPPNSVAAFLPPTSGEFRPPWLPERTNVVGGRPWQPLPSSPLLLHPQRGFAPSPLLPSARGPLLLPALDFSRLAASGGLLSPLGFSSPLLEQCYHRPPSVSSTTVVASSSPLQLFYSNAPLHLKPPLSSSSLDVPTAAESQKRKRVDSLRLEEEEAAERDYRGGGGSALQQSFASGYPLPSDVPLKSHQLAASRSSPDARDYRTNTPPSGADAGAWRRWRTSTAATAPSLVGVAAAGASLVGVAAAGPILVGGAAAAVPSLVGVAAAMPAPIMSVRPASSSSGGLARPGHPAHFTQVNSSRIKLLSFSFSDPYSLNPDPAKSHYEKKYLRLLPHTDCFS